MNHVEAFDLYGVEAKQIPTITGEGAPTTATEGAVGCLYMDTTNGDLYKCTAATDGAFTWVKHETGGADVYQDGVNAVWELGSLYYDKGGEYDNKTRVRSSKIYNTKMRLNCDGTVNVRLYFYSYTASSDFLGRSESISTPANVVDYAPDGTDYVRIVASYTDSREITDVAAIVSSINARAMIGTDVNPYTDYAPDVPENIGVLNAILNFKQLAEIKQPLLADMPGLETTFKAETTLKGIPYSSTRVDEAFVPNFVSLYTYMSALQNPKSYLYTVNMHETYGNLNGKTYYGAVCSTACGHALNLVPNYTTNQWGEIPGMEEIPWQSVHALKLGDTICGNGHVVMVTDIHRNKRGKIGKITITEAAGNKVQSFDYTPDELKAKYPTDVWTYYRYSKTHEVTHDQSPFVAVEDETPMEPTYNTAIIPKKGDKANWLVGETVEIDLLKKTGYTEVEVLKDDAPYSTIPLGGGTTPPDRTIYFRDWYFGDMSDTINDTMITQKITPLHGDVIVSVQDGAEARIRYYDSAQTAIEYTPEWESGTIAVSSNAPEGAAMFKIVVRLAGGATITDKAAVGAMVRIYVSDNSTVIPINFEHGSIDSKTGNETAGASRCRSTFLPLQNWRLDVADAAKYYIYYYDSDKAWISNSGGWVNSSTVLLDAAPEGTAYIRLVVGGDNDAQIDYTVLGVYASYITATILGGMPSEDGETLKVLTLPNLPYGEYKARLTNGTSHSEWCYWIVVDAVCSAVSSGPGSREATVTFSCSNNEVTPLFVKWSGGVDNGTKHINVLTDEEKAAGTATVKYETAFNDGQNNTYKMRVAFQTKYGIIHTPLPDDAITV